MLIERKHFFYCWSMFALFSCSWKSAIYWLFWTDFKVLRFQLNLPPLFTTYLTAASGAATPVNNRKQIEINYWLCRLVNEFFYFGCCYLFIYFLFWLIKSIEFRFFERKNAHFYANLVLLLFKEMSKIGTKPKFKLLWKCSH